MPDRFLLLATAVVLALFWTPGVVGMVGDGRQMIFTAVAIAETGSLGQARSRDLTVPRPEGDSVSRYGLGMSVLHVPAALLAPVVEERRGPGSSQFLFLIAPWMLVLACGALAARTARDLGAPGGARAALLLATIASPFGSYAGMELSEPLQAFALLGAFAAAVRSASSKHVRRASSSAMLAGFFVSLAVLTKSSLLVVAPLALAPLFASPRSHRARLLRSLAAGFAPVAAMWIYFEVARFGRPLAGYAGEGFTHPFLDGAWRLLAGPNKGLLLYFPAALVAVVALVRGWRTDPVRAATLAGGVLPIAGLWILAAPWWAWHGVDGWGPRLLVPGIPLLAAVAAVELARWPRAARWSLIALCAAINLPPLLQHPTPVVRYTWLSAWPAVAPEEAARVPPFARQVVDGSVRIPPDQILAAVPSASPFILLPWFYRAMHADPEARLALLNQPPWLASRPDIRPSPPLSAESADAVVHPRFDVYDAALGDQIMRAQQLRQRDRALELSHKLQSLAPGGIADALLLESYRLLGRKSEAIDWLTSLSRERRSNPAINVVLALWDRDDGREEEARALLQSSAGSYRSAVLQRALTSPLSAWPSDFASMTADPSVEVRYN